MKHGVGMQKTNDRNSRPLSPVLERVLKNAELNEAAMQFLKDLDAFLRYVDVQAEIKLSKVNQTLPLKYMLEVEQYFQKIFKPTRTPRQVYHLEVHFFMTTCRALAILRVDAGNYLTLTAYGKKFRQFPKWQQYGLILETFWERVLWESLMPQMTWHRRDRTQAEAPYLAETLYNAPARQTFRYHEFWVIQNHQGFQKLLNGSIKRLPVLDKSIYSEGVWVQKILPLLSYMGLLQIEVTFPTSRIEAAREPVIIHKLLIT